MRRARALLALGLAASACGDPPVTGPGPATPGSTSAQGSARPGQALEYLTDDGAWGKFHSRRFQLTVPLPEGRAWKIDDHRQPTLVAVHPPTSSRLSILTTQEPALMNRQRCEERARSSGWVPSRPLMTVEDQVHVGPEAYDSRVWVALDPARADGGIEGHVFLFGAFLRTCLLVHLSTLVTSSRDEEVLASRLALASARIIKGIQLDPLRTTDDATVPRDRPDLRR